MRVDPHLIAAISGALAFLALNLMYGRKVVQQRKERRRRSKVIHTGGWLYGTDQQSSAAKQPETKAPVSYIRPLTFTRMIPRVFVDEATGKRYEIYVPATFK